MSSLLVLLAIGAITLVYFTFGTKKTDTGEKPLLKLPLIGDLHSSPIEKPLLNWDKWALQNGPIAVPKLFGLIPIVVLNTQEAVTELFSKRSQWYSNRPASVSMEMITGAEPGKSRFTLMHDYDDHLKLHHRILSPSLGAPAAGKYQPLMELEGKQLLFDLITNVEKGKNRIISTDDIYPLLERTQSSVILGLHYGLRIPTFENHTLHEIIDIQSKVTHLAGNPQLPDMMPFLRHLPASISPWQKAADKLFATQEDLYMRLFNHGRDSEGWNATKQAIATAEKYAPKNEPVSDLDLAFTLATSIQGGMETSPRQLLWLFIAALQDRSFLTKAHEVLDNVVGRDRLPTFADRSNLTYIDAVTHELFRWRPISPGSIPRRADSDDSFADTKIKKGWTVIANAWAVGRDEKVFDPALGDTQSFIPDRWIKTDSESGSQKLRSELPLPVFGQGRRICQGKRVATDGTFMQVACLLWAFDVEPLLDGEGEEGEAAVDPWEMVVVGFMTMPRPRRFRLKPRGDWVVDIVKRTWESAEKGVDVVMGGGRDVE
ncbi:cytochrome P450 [Aspergillus stella-maris]|uniref:cytochrome P450 n=1 Tax=Aspergillus stella-maris TaxID=1810926 RepID=UPI003CCE3FB1